MCICMYVRRYCWQLLIGVKCVSTYVHCLQAVGVASEHQNSLQHQDTGAYALPNVDKYNNVQKVCKHLQLYGTLWAVLPGLVAA